MSLKRILKLLAAFLTGQGVAIITQLLVPPFFLHRYPHGVEVYGEWVALTASVTYLNTLNYGIQNYANNQMAIHYNRGEVEEAKAVQASAVRLLLAAVAGIGALAATVLLMPVSRWLGLTTIGSLAASTTIFLLILQILVIWAFLLLANSYMVIGQAHRGVIWMNAQRLTAVLAMAVCLWHRAPFPVLALVQLVSAVLYTILVAIEVRIRAPILLPALRYGCWRQARSMIKPSAWFAMIAVSGFLWMQGPILLIQKILGPVAVAVFALSRVLFNMSRQLLVVVTYAISQEITHLVGQRNWQQLRRLYDLSEKVVLFLIPPVTIGTLLLCPFLFSVWLHKRSLYDPAICLAMAAISGVMGIKEHKYQFQWSSNEHISLSRFSLWAYSAMLLISAFLLRPFGVGGFLAVWMLTEMTVLTYLLRLNARLFPAEVVISRAPLYRLAGIVLVALTFAAWPAWHSAHWPLRAVVFVAAAAISGLAVLDYFAFGLSDVQSVFRNRLRRFAAAK